MNPDLKSHRQARLAERFVVLADTLVDDYDVAEVFDDLMEACIELLDVDAAGLLLTEPAGRLQRIASSSESAEILELLQLETREGPCVDSVTQGIQVIEGDLENARDRWPAFTTGAATAGFASAYSFPLRLRHEAIGGLNLFSRHKHALDQDDRVIAQALADVATIGILQQRSVHRSTILAENLQRALNTRVLIEQAKGVLAEHGNLPMDVTFAILRAYARSHHLKLSDLAHSIVYPPHLAASVLAATTEPSP